MVKNSYWLLPVICFVTLSPSLTAGTCVLEPSDQTIGIPAFDKSNGASREIIGFDSGSNEPIYPPLLKTEFGTVVGSDIIYNGVARPGYFLYGPYRSFEDVSNASFMGFIMFSTKWSPSGREYCSKHKTKIGQNRVCVQKSIAYDPTSFTVDVTHESGTQIITSRTFTNINNANNNSIVIPRISCTGGVNALEFRIKDITGGSVEFKVHSISLQWGTQS